MLIRLATHADALTIALLSQAQIEQGLVWSWTPARVHHAIRDRDSNVVVAVADARVVGFGIMIYRERTAHLCLLAVAPDHQRRRIGAALLAWLERVARVAGIERIGLEARQDNRSALAFYAHHGYTRTAVVAGMYQGLLDGVRLHKQLC